MSVLDYFRPLTKQKLVRGEYVHWVDSHKRARYIRSCVLSFPPWVDRQELKALFDEARALELATGVKHSIDHIIPLQHPLVCGLSVPCNLQVITLKCNVAKGNYWSEDQLELF